MINCTYQTMSAEKHPCSPAPFPTGEAEQEMWVVNWASQQMRNFIMQIFEGNFLDCGGGSDEGKITFTFFLKKLQLIYNVVSISAVQQNESYIYIYIHYIHVYIYIYTHILFLILSVINHYWLHLLKCSSFESYSSCLQVIIIIKNL